MQRKLFILLSFLLMVSMLIGCGGAADAPATEPKATAPVAMNKDEAPTADPNATPVPTSDQPAPTVAVPDGQDFSIEINQAIGVQFQNGQNYVAGKKTAILGYLKAAAKVDEATTSAVIMKNGAAVTTLKPKTVDAPSAVVEFLCPDMPTCGDWAAGSYTVEMTINGSKAASPAVNFVESKMVRVLAVNVKAKYGATVTQVKGEDWKKMDDYTRATYPIGEANLKWTVRDELDASMQDLETDEGRLGLWQMLKALVPDNCTANPAGDGCYEMVVGFISDRPRGFPNGVLQGYTYGAPATIAVASDQDARATVAHEIAHVYAIGDTYAGGSINCKVNPAPDGMTGSNWDDRANQTSCTAGAKQFSPTVSATLIDAAVVHPYEVGGRGILPNQACFMGSGGKQEDFWVTQETYASLFKSLSKGQSASKGYALVSHKTAAAPIKMLYYFGYIKADDTFVPEPWYTISEVDSEALPTSPTGDKVSVKVLDADGKELASKDDKVNFYPNTAPGEKIVKVNEAALEGVVAFADNAAKVQVVFKDKVIYEAAVSANAPTVSDVTPTEAGQKLDGPFKLTWKGSDADNDKLSYTVEFNPDVTNQNSEWQVLASDLTDSQWEEDLSQWPGGAHAKFRVTATDGIRAGEGSSQEFTVPFKAPEVFIYEPEWGAQYKVGDEIALTADVFDMQDDVLPDESLVWTSDLVEKPLGLGQEIITSLPAGTHTITLTVKNSVGLTTKTVLETKIVVK